MQSSATTPEDYLASLPDDRKYAVGKLRDVFKQNLPDGFAEVMAYGMLGFVVPHSLYPAGYHCDTKQPLPFVSIASQKNHIAVYHMGLYAPMGHHASALLDWFVDRWSAVSKRKLDMGKSCIRLKKVEDIPYELFGELASKMSPEEWIAIYESVLKR